MDYLLDTNVVSELVKAVPNGNVLRWLKFTPDSHLYLSVLTVGEVRKGVEKVIEAKKKARLLFWLEHELLTSFENRILPVTIDIADRWGSLEKETARTLSAVDGLLAATALQKGMTLVTRNVKDFCYPRLRIVNPWEEL